MYPVFSKDNSSGNRIPKQNAKIIYESLEKGISPLLPDVNGNLISNAIYNCSSGHILNAVSLIPAQIIQMEAGYTMSNKVCSYNAANKLGTSIRKDETGLFYNWLDKDQKTYHTTVLFFAEQLEKPELLKNSKTKIAYISDLSDCSVEVTKSKDYMKFYIAAAKSGLNVKVSPSVTEEFKKSLIMLAKNEAAPDEKKILSLPKIQDFLYEEDIKAIQLIKTFPKKNFSISKKSISNKEKEEVL